MLVYNVPLFSNLVNFSSATSRRSRGAMWPSITLAFFRRRGAYW